VSLLVFRRVAMRLAGVALLLVLPALGKSASAADPSQLVQNTAQQVIDIVKNKTGADRQAAILAVLQASFDMPAMGRSALGTHWNQATEEERMRFLKAVSSAEARAYSERFGQYAGQTLTVGKVLQRANGASIVESKLNQATGQPIKIDWEVRGDRITDVKVEGVSMVMTRRSDFNSYIQNNGGKVDALVQELESRAGR